MSRYRLNPKPHSCSSMDIDNALLHSSYARSMHLSYEVFQMNTMTSWIRRHDVSDLFATAIWGNVFMNMQPFNSLTRETAVLFNRLISRVNTHREDVLNMNTTESALSAIQTVRGWKCHILSSIF